MMDTIDLDAIIQSVYPSLNAGPNESPNLKKLMKEAIHQALVLFAKKGRIINMPNFSFADDYTDYMMIDERSILEVEKLIK